MAGTAPVDSSELERRYLCMGGYVMPNFSSG
jgi:hypothetical protein